MYTDTVHGYPLPQFTSMGAYQYMFISHCLWHECLSYMVTLNIREEAWIYCPRHAEVHGNERTDSLAVMAPMTGVLRLGRTEIMRKMNGCLVRDETLVEKTI